MADIHDLIDSMSNPTGQRYGGAKVWFELVKERNHTKTDEEGRAIFDYIECICIQHPGDSSPNVKRAKPADIAAYPLEYKAFKQEEAPPPVSGTPLIEWSLMPRSLAQELTHNGIYTLEQLADLPEKYGHVYSKLGPAQEWCQKAEDELKRSKDRSSMTKTKAENKKLSAEVKALREQVRQLSQRIEAEQGVRFGNDIST